MSGNVIMSEGQIESIPSESKLLNAVRMNETLLSIVLTFPLHYRLAAMNLICTLSEYTAKSHADFCTRVILLYGQKGDIGLPPVSPSVRLKVRVKLRDFADLDFDLDPNWGITPKIETLYIKILRI